MGLSIHYSGKLRNPVDIPALIAEAADISKSMHWEAEILPHFDDIPIQGVLVIPEGSEPLWLTFHEKGSMCHPILYEHVREIEGKDFPEVGEQWCVTKTQYAGVESHMAMIKFLRYMSEKYFERFELHDESQYWETNDEAICRKRFGEYEKIMGMVGDALDSMEIRPEESQESIVEKIEKMLEERFGMKRM
jgi:hypothetical protein